MFLFVFEFLGTTELLVILVVALVLFGPRRLPELGRTLGKSLGEFKRATDDFKRTWEREVEMDKLTREVRIDEEVREAREALDLNYTPPALEPAGDAHAPAAAQPEAGGLEGHTIARGSAPMWHEDDPHTAEAAEAAEAPAPAFGGDAGSDADAAPREPAEDGARGRESFAPPPAAGGAS